MRGKSKDKRDDLPQVVIEAVIGDNKLVIHHATHAGNTSDKALPTASAAALKKLGYQQVQWTSDAGFNSAANRDALRAADFEFISAAAQEGERRLPLRLQVQAHQVTFEPLGEVGPGKRATYRIQMKAVQLGDGWLTARVTHAMSDAPVELSEPTTVNP